MNIGKLRHRVVIQALQPVPDGGGGYTEDWVDTATVWANVEPLQGSTFVQAQKLKVQLTHRVTMRFRPLSDANRLKHKGRILDIDFILNVEERNEQLKINCAESR